MFEKFTPAARDAVARAQVEADHKLSAELGVGADAVRSALATRPPRRRDRRGRRLTPDAERVLREARDLAVARRQAITEVHLALALVASIDRAARNHPSDVAVATLKNIGVDPDNLCGRIRDA